MKGSLTVVLRDRDGNIVRIREVGNLIVSTGKTLIANLFRGEETQPATHMAVGAGKNQPSSGDTMLESELPPRSPFDKNFLSEEKSAVLIMRDAARKDVLKLTSRISGERGNRISVEVKKSGSDTFTILVHGEIEEWEMREEFEDLSMDGRNDRYVESTVNGESRLIHVRRLVNSTPANLERTYLVDGEDAVVTLGATFGYEECNGPISEAGIFNAEREGTMYNRVVFPEINKTDKLTLSLIWKVSF